MVIRRLVNKSQSYLIDFDYAKEVRKKSSIPTVNKKCAIVLHLYYPEMWSEIKQHLDRLEEAIKFDLYISVPKYKKNEIENINFGNAHVLFVPNRGRDVLPFLKTLDILVAKNYTFLLKIHSKKSPQREQGEKWSKDLLEKLIPHRDTLSLILKMLESPETGLIGPSDNYLPLSAYSVDNDIYIKRALDIIYSPEKTAEIYDHRDNYGFFAGTMFWIRIDMLQGVVDAHFSTTNFSPESGQLDGTFAHGLERVFSLIPQIEQKVIYEVKHNRVVPRDYRSTRTQESWDKSAANKKIV